MRPCTLTLALLALLALLAPGLCAQAIDRQRSGFATEPQARPGTCAPFRLQFDAPAGSTAKLEVHWGKVVLTREVAVAGPGATALLPVPAVPGARVVVRVGDQQDWLEPAIPPRSASAAHSQPYVAMFASDPLYARAILPNQPGTMLVDYFSTEEFFADWRLADGYDALVLLNPDDARLPQGSQRAIAEFCSLGGAVIVAGSFRFGELASALPAPGEPVPMLLREVPALRFEYGAGAIYRFEWEALRRARSAQAVVQQALSDHLWQGAAVAPGGPAPSRAAPAGLPLLIPGPPAQAAPGPGFWVLASALLLVCLLAPLLATRLSAAGWLPGAMLAGLALAIGGLALLQTGPAVMADAWTVVLAGPRDDGPRAWRSFVVAESSVTVWRINLDDAANRALPRPLPAIDGRPAWLVDLPLAPRGLSGPVVELRQGLIAGQGFRDFAAEARTGGAGFGREPGRLLDWWLETHAWRGRMAALAPAQVQQVPVPPGCEPRPQGAIAVTLWRHEPGN